MRTFLIVAALATLLAPSRVFADPVELKTYPERSDLVYAAAFCNQVVDTQIDNLNFMRMPFTLDGERVSEDQYRSHAVQACIRSVLNPPKYILLRPA